VRANNRRVMRQNVANPVALGRYLVLRLALSVR
jgi:hypothetical protein